MLHHKIAGIPAFALVVAKNGPKIHEWKESDAVPEFGSGGHANSFRDRGPIQRLVDVLSSKPEIGRPALDKTGLK